MCAVACTIFASLQSCGNYPAFQAREIGNTARFDNLSRSTGARFGYTGGYIDDPEAEFKDHNSRMTISMCHPDTFFDCLYQQEVVSSISAVEE
jgi:hypothetical protein